MITTIGTLLEHLWRSLTCDRGIEMVKHRYPMEHLATVTVELNGRPARPSAGTAEALNQALKALQHERCCGRPTDFA
jgi:hypothetical protein